ncbi:cytochrome c peroxidase [Oricola sp.]|uniref:cytochrome-c peroxidase n=1 Tax=Oricola sp. TaxID=1979950 RepID=UPI0025FF10FB|nr:cytochrome c peroxidase [Oricola sp.]MCI5076693.1 c-type cytochrome [Oricola sp.]
MNGSAIPVVAYGALFLLGGLLALALIVRGDLVPDRVAGGGGRLMLGAALGFGLVSIAVKLAVIVVLATFPRQFIDGQLPTAGERLERAARQHARSASPLIVAAAKPVPEARKWYPLPATAPAPPDNPSMPARVALGRRLFHDANLSADRTVSCASCHDVTAGAGGDGRPVALGVGGQAGTRNAPTVYNAAFQARLFWDGRAGSLEEQASGPLLNPVEMGMASPADIEARVREDEAYRPLFDAAFEAGAPVTIDGIVKAIAAYERTLVSNDAPYDRFVAGDEDALTFAQKRGMALFLSLGCRQCHAGPNFSGASLVGPKAVYRPFSVSRSPRAIAFGLGDDKGRAGADAASGVWRVPSLRNVALTAPYFHNGAVDDLAGAVRIMAATQLNALVGEAGEPPEMELRWSAATRTLETIERTRVTDRDVADLVAFLEALSGDRLASRMGADGQAYGAIK